MILFPVCCREVDEETFEELIKVISATINFVCFKLFLQFRMNLPRHCALCSLKIDNVAPEHMSQTEKREIPMLFVRGDGVILVSPPLRGGVSTASARFL